MLNRSELAKFVVPRGDLFSHFLTDWAIICGTMWAPPTETRPIEPRIYFRRRQSQGRIYLQIVESQRSGDQVRQRVIATLGRRLHRERHCCL